MTALAIRVSGLGKPDDHIWALRDVLFEATHE